MIPVLFDQIDLAALQRLIAQRRSEDQTIEFKGRIPGNADGEKVPWLLKPVCSFANSEGGDLVLGLEANQGRAVAVDGCVLSDADVDAALLRLEEILRSGIDPLVGGVRVKAVEIDEGRYAIVIRVPKSWTAPHRVKGNRMFYARGAAGSFELDVPQLRQAFLLSDGIQKTIQNFRAERVSKIIAGDTPLPLRAGLRMITHVLPLTSFTSGRTLAAELYAPSAHRMAPAGLGNLSWQIGVDGVTVYDPPTADGSAGYSIFFREGRAEFVHVFHQERAGDPLNLPSVYYERVCIESVRLAISRLAAFNIVEPFYIGLSLVNANGYKLGVGTRVALDQTIRSFDREHMLFPMLEVYDSGSEPSRFLRPSFDLVWNAAGCEKSLNYDAEGNWSSDRQ